MSRGNPEAVKVIFIDTQYVETDATSFKSVVQKIIGKDFVATAVGLGPGPSERTRRTVEVATAAVTKSSGVGERSGGGGGGGGGGGASLPREVSFKEPDRWFMELPPLDELQRLSAD